MTKKINIPAQIVVAINKAKFINYDSTLEYKNAFE